MVHPLAASTMFLHGLESSSQGDKARQLSALGVATPDFSGSLAQRMQQLRPLLIDGELRTLVGSSFGGLMAALWAVEHPQQVRRLILLAPALHRPDFGRPAPVNTETILIHGDRDEVVPPAEVAEIARSTFPNLRHLRVDDDHRLRSYCSQLDWPDLLWGAFTP